MLFEKTILKELKVLYKLDNYHGIFAVLWDYLQIILTIAISCFMHNIFMYLFAVLFIGTRQRALATILHESAHRILAKNRKLNDFLGKYPSGYLIFQTFEKYRQSHVIKHHGFLGIENKDPDYDFYIQSKLFASRSLKEFIFRHLILPLFLGKTFDFISYLIRNRLGDFKDKEIKYLILFWIAIFGICFYVNVLDILLMYWFVPLLTSFPMVGHFIEMAEHFPMIKNKREIEKSWNRFGNKIELFFTGLHKENYHLIHHLFANIPFWNLDKAHNILCKNEEYRLLNSNMGGIFSSSNKASSLWKKIIKKELKIC